MRAFIKHQVNTTFQNITIQFIQTKYFITKKEVDENFYTLLKVEL